MYYATGLQGALAELSTLGFSWKKTKERNRKIVCFIFFEKKKIARAATLAEIPSKIRGHLEKLKLSVGSSSAGAGRYNELKIMSCVSTLTISCMCKLTHEVDPCHVCHLHDHL